MRKIKLINIPEFPFAWTGWAVAGVLLLIMAFNSSNIGGLNQTGGYGVNPPGGGFVPGVGGGPPANINEPSTDQVSLQAIPIRKIINSRVMWVGPSDSEQVLLVLNKNFLPDNQVSKLNLKEGLRVDLTAVVKMAPDSAQSQQRWGLSSSDANLLTNEQFYLLVSQLTPSSM